MKSSLRTLAHLFGEFAALAILLFVVRFVLRGHLVPQLDEECNLGGIAVDVLAYGIRFPLAAYAPNDYENGFFYSGLLTALSFSLLGRSVLALKLTTHLIVSMGALATLWLLRTCLDELRLRTRAVRWTAITALIVATAFSPREIALFSTCAVGIGSHPEGTAIDMVLLSLFARGRAHWSTMSITAFWALTGLAVHVNKGTLVVILVLAAAELTVARRSPRRLGAAALGLLLGSAPEWIAMARTDAGIGGWATLASKLTLHARNFPAAFVSDVLALADYRVELLAVWVLAIALAPSLLRQARRRSLTLSPSALGLTCALLVLHTTGLTLMAQGGVDYYPLHAYTLLTVLVALLAGWLCATASERWGGRSGTWAGAMIVGLTVLVHRPGALSPGFEQVAALWNKRGGAACSWRFGEAFVRLQGPSAANDALRDTPTVSGRDRHSQLHRQRRAIDLCRSLSEAPQILDCIGGVARDAHFGWGIMDGEPPPALNGIERRAFAFYFGVRKDGQLTRCDDFLDAALRRECKTAVQLDCLIRADLSTRFASGRPLGRPDCDVPEPPMDGYYAEMRAELLSRPTGRAPEFPRGFGESLGECQAVIASCY